MGSVSDDGGPVTEDWRSLFRVAMYIVEHHIESEDWRESLLPRLTQFATKAPQAMAAAAAAWSRRIVRAIALFERAIGALPSVALAGAETPSESASTSGGSLAISSRVPARHIP